MTPDETYRRPTSPQASGEGNSGAKIIQVAQIRAARLGFGFVDVRSVELSENILRTVPASIAQEYSILPLAWEQERLVVAMSDPPSPEQLDRLRFTLDRPITVVLAVKEHLRQAIAKWYQGEEKEELAEEPGPEPESSRVEFVQVEVETPPAAGPTVSPDAPEVTRAIQALLGEGIRLGATRAAVVQFRGTAKVGYLIDDGICTHTDLPLELLAPMAGRLIAMTNFYGTIKIVVRGVERRLKANCRSTPYGLALVIDFDKDESAIQAARERASMLSYSFEPLENPQIPADVLSMVSRDVARALHVLPLSVTNDVVVVAMADPPSPEKTNELRFALGRSFQVVLAPQGRLRVAIERAYGPADPESVTVLLAELTRTTQQEVQPRAIIERPSPPQGHPAEAVLDYLRHFAKEKLLDIFEDIRRRPKLCVRSAKEWQMEVVIPRAEMISLLPPELRSYLENRLWLVRESIVARLFNLLVQEETVRNMALAYALYVAACQIAAEERGNAVDPVLLLDEWFNFLYCFILKNNPKIETNAALMDYLVKQPEALVELVSKIIRDPTLVHNAADAEKWLQHLAQQTLVGDVINEQVLTPDAILKLVVAEARHYRASHLLILPHEETLEACFRIQNRVLCTLHFPVCWCLPVLSRMLGGLLKQNEWQVSMAGKTIQAQVRLYGTTYGLAALAEFPPDHHAVETSQALAMSAGCAFMRLNEVEIAEDVLRLMNGGAARHLSVLPVRADDSTVVVAMSQPPTSRKLQELQLLLNRPIEAVIAPEDELLAAIYRAYPPARRFQPSPEATYFFQRYTGLLHPVV